MIDRIMVRRYEAPCGTLLVGGLGDRICLCDWANGKHRELIDRRLKRLLNADIVEGTLPVVEKAASQLDEYFAGTRRKFDLRLLFAGTEFQERVWKELLSIPYGEFISYGELARRIGSRKATRAVANANGMNAMSILVPCHRVNGSDNSLTGYGGGLRVKKFLLDLEGRRS